MRRPKLTLKKLGEGLHEIRVLLETPDSAEANSILETIVRRYESKALEAVFAQGLILHSRWPHWYRALQVRFVQLACVDRGSIKATIQRELADCNRPTPERLMREVFRICFSETFAWGKANKDKPKKRQDPRPTGPEVFWKEAWSSLDRDMGFEVAHGRTAENAPAEWFSVLGIDYSL